MQWEPCLLESKPQQGTGGSFRVLEPPEASKGGHLLQQLLRPTGDSFLTVAVELSLPRLQLQEGW